MVDRPVIRKAKRTVWLARDYGLEETASEVIAALEKMGEEQEKSVGVDLVNHFIKFIRPREDLGVKRVKRDEKVDYDWTHKERYARKAAHRQGENLGMWVDP
jgi:hypothetical protein